MSAVAEPPTQTAPEATPPTKASVPNKWCIIRGTPGTDPLTIIGPFDTSEEASQYNEKDTEESMGMVDILVDKANC